MIQTTTTKTRQRRRVKTLSLRLFMVRREFGARGELMHLVIELDRKAKVLDRHRLIHWGCGGERGALCGCGGCFDLGANAGLPCIHLRAAMAFEARRASARMRRIGDEAAAGAALQRAWDAEAATLRLIQPRVLPCEARDALRVRVPSLTDRLGHYDVHLGLTAQGELTFCHHCECGGWEFSGECKHGRLALLAMGCDVAARPTR